MATASVGETAKPTTPAAVTSRVVAIVLRVLCRECATVKATTTAPALNAPIRRPASESAG